MENENALLETPSLEPTVVDWVSLVAAWEASGLTREKFCEQHHLNYRHFVYQRNKLSAKRKSKSSPWLAIKQTPLKSPAISATTAANPIQVFLLRSSQGHQLSIPLDADTPTLKLLLAFMREN